MRGSNLKVLLFILIISSALWSEAVISRDKTGDTVQSEKTLDPDKSVSNNDYYTKKSDYDSSRSFPLGEISQRQMHIRGLINSNVVKSIRGKVEQFDQINSLLKDNYRNLLIWLLLAYLFSVGIKLVVLFLTFDRFSSILLQDIWFKTIVACTIGTALTMVVIWFIFPLFIKFYIVRMVISLPFAIIVEAYFYNKLTVMSSQKALMFSAICTLIVYLAGMLTFFTLISLFICFC